MSALTEQVGGSHYMDCKIQPIQYIEANKLSFLEACVVKRVTRHDKPTGKGRQDIEKAIHEMQLLLELRYGAVETQRHEGSPRGLALGYTKCPHCKEVTRAEIGAQDNKCEQCGGVFTLTVEHFNEERMDVIGQNGNDGEHYEKPWINWGGGICPVPEGTKVDIRYRNSEELFGMTAGIDQADQSYWDKDGMSRDIVAYRLA